MTNELTLETARTLDTPQLLKILQSGLLMAAEGIKQACISVCILKERGVDLPVLPALFHYAADVAEGRLSPHAGFILGNARIYIEGIMKLPCALQDAVADGQKIKIAVRLDGRIRSKDVTIMQMTPLQMRLAFSADGFTPWEEQGEYLLKSGQGKPAAPPKIKPPAFDRKTGDIVVGRHRYKPSDFYAAFAAAGLQIKPIYGVRSIRHAHAASDREMSSPHP